MSFHLPLARWPLHSCNNLAALLFLEHTQSGCFAPPQESAPHHAMATVIPYFRLKVWKRCWYLVLVLGVGTETCFARCTQKKLVIIWDYKMIMAHQAGKGQGSLASRHPRVLQGFAACQILADVEEITRLISARNTGVIPI